MMSKQNLNSNSLSEKNETESQDSYNDYDMKISICSIPTLHNRMCELNEGKIIERIEALNMQYDKRENESSSEISDIETWKYDQENKIFPNDDPNQGCNIKESNFNEEDASININELLYKSLKDKKEINSIYVTNRINSEAKSELLEKMGNENGKSEKNDLELNKNLMQNPHQGKQEIQKNVSINTSRISEFEVINQDHYLKPYEGKIRERSELMSKLIKDIESNEKSLLEFSEGYKKLGLNVVDDGIIFREYAPGAKAISLFGEFNNWKRNEYNLTREEFGFWSVKIPRNSKDISLPIKHNTKIKLHLTLANNKCEDRNPVYCSYLLQNKDSYLHDGVFWYPEKPYEFKYPQPVIPSSIRIYEAHVGMSSIEPKVASYRYFADNILLRIKEAGYNTVQLMGIMEHAYYGSFGYHVTNFFAISSRCGNPDDLKYLIDKAHSLGLYVLIDLIHSHASSNVLDGLNNFDGTDYLYFHGGERGYHKLWDSRVFNYKDWETLRFLLSNLNWWLTEYKFDGFRFDGITSMLYLNHGINYTFTGKYSEYFNSNVDLDSCVYLMIANKLIKKINPNAITIAEDVSGMPTLCRPIEEGGFGFDYRLNMSIPDKWIQLLKEIRDEQWNMGNIVYTLTNRRHNEKHIGYCESHDQSIVGDKTISMWLFGKEIYTNMDIHKKSIVMDRGMALHKMIRLLTYSLGGEGYLNFMGNEFGHPEWVDFPRKENNYSYHYCRRRWDLCDNISLKYKFLHNFDKAMHALETNYSWLLSKHQYISLVDEGDKLIVFEKGELLFIFNFHPNKSYEHYRIGTKWASGHKILLDSDESRFGGYDRLNYGHNNYFPIIREKWNNRANHFHIYIPSRTAIVFIAEENLIKGQ